MNESLLLFLIFFYVFCKTSDITAYNKEEDKIMINNFVQEINEKSINKTVNENNNVLIMFYKNDNKLNKKIFREYKKAAYFAKENGFDIIFTKFEIVNDNQKAIWKINTFPQILFYSYGQKYSYNGAKTKKGFQKFIRSELTTNYLDCELQETSIINNTNLLYDSKTIILFIGDFKIHYKEIIKYYRLTKDYIKRINFYWTDKTFFFNQFNISSNQNSLVVFKYIESSNSFEKGKILNTFNYRDLKTKIKLYSNKILREFNEEKYSTILSKGIPSTILIYGEGDKIANRIISKKYINEYYMVAEKYQDYLWSFIYDYNKKKLDHFLQIFEVKREELPTLVIYNDQEFSHRISKYKFNRTEGPLNRISYGDFIEKWINGKLVKFGTSEEIPDDPFNIYGVYHVVWNNFKDFLKIDKNLFLMVCTDLPDEIDCIEVRSRINAISARFKNSDNLIFGFFDPIKNENELIDFNYVPELLFFSPNFENKISTMKKFARNYTTNEMIEFIKDSAINTHLIDNGVTETEEKFINNEKIYKKRKLDEVPNFENEEEEHVNFDKTMNHTEKTSEYILELSSNQDERIFEL